MLSSTATPSGVTRKNSHRRQNSTPTLDGPIPLSAAAGRRAHRRGLSLDHRAASLYPPQAHALLAKAHHNLPPPSSSPIRRSSRHIPGPNEQQANLENRLPGGRSVASASSSALPGKPVRMVPRHTRHQSLHTHNSRVLQNFSLPNTPQISQYQFPPAFPINTSAYAIPPSSVLPSPVPTPQKYPICLDDPFDMALHPQSQYPAMDTDEARIAIGSGMGMDIGLGMNMAMPVQMDIPPITPFDAGPFGGDLAGISENAPVFFHPPSARPTHQRAPTAPSLRTMVMDPFSSQAMPRRMPDWLHTLGGPVTSQAPPPPPAQISSFDTSVPPSMRSSPVPEVPSGDAPSFGRPSQMDLQLPSSPPMGGNMFVGTNSMNASPVKIEGDLRALVKKYISEQDPETKKWSCLYPECEKKTARWENACAHVQTHLGIRPWQCETCQKEFVRQHDLKRHLKIHSGIKPYLCNCGSSFARQDALTRHMERPTCSATNPQGPKARRRGRPKKNPSLNADDGQPSLAQKLNGDNEGNDDCHDGPDRVGGLGMIPEVPPMSDNMSSPTLISSSMSMLTVGIPGGIAQPYPPPLASGISPSDPSGIGHSPSDLFHLPGESSFSTESNLMGIPLPDDPSLSHDGFKNCDQLELGMSASSEMSRNDPKCFLSDLGISFDGNLGVSLNHHSQNPHHLHHSNLKICPSTSISIATSSTDPSPNTASPGGSGGSVNNVACLQRTRRQLPSSRNSLFPPANRDHRRVEGGSYSTPPTSPNFVLENGLSNGTTTTSTAPPSLQMNGPSLLLCPSASVSGTRSDGPSVQLSLSTSDISASNESNGHSNGNSFDFNSNDIYFPYPANTGIEAESPAFSSGTRSQNKQEKDDATASAGRQSGDPVAEESALINPTTLVEMSKGISAIDLDQMWSGMDIKMCGVGAGVADAVMNGDGSGTENQKREAEKYQHQLQHPHHPSTSFDHFMPDWISTAGEEL